MHCHEVKFSVTAHAIWIPESDAEPAVKKMSSLLRRRASFPGKMALEVAFNCLEEYKDNIPTIFCSRHGECGRSAELLTDLVQNTPISPTSFSLSVHNATNGLFSIARRDHSNSIAIAAGASTIEHGIIEACGLLADDTKAVLLIAYDNTLPAIFKEFEEDNKEQPYAWAWLMQPAKDHDHVISLSWSAAENHSVLNASQENQENADLEVYRCFIDEIPSFTRVSNNQLWQWKYDAKKD